jgi:hypothetical protein
LADATFHYFHRSSYLWDQSRIDDEFNAYARRRKFWLIEEFPALPNPKMLKRRAQRVRSTPLMLGAPNADEIAGEMANSCSMNAAETKTTCIH